MNRHSAAVLLLLLAGCSNLASDKDKASSPVALVTLGTATRGSIEQTMTLYGAVEKGAEAQYALSVPVAAVVSEIAAPVGTAVRTGQLVARLQPSPATRAQIAKAMNDASAAQSAYARAKRLRADGLASDADVESARAAAKSAEAAHAAITSSLVLRAHVPGHVETVPVNPGDLVAAGATIATLSRSGHLRARFGIDPADATRLHRGERLRITPAGGGTAFNAPILSIDPVTDTRTRLASVFVAVPARSGLAAGQPLAAIAPVATSRNALTVPYAALLNDGGQPYVFVVRKGVARRHDVVTGSSSGKRIAITKGVAAGDEVVTAGGTALEDGMKVRTR